MTLSKLHIRIVELTKTKENKMNKIMELNSVGCGIDETGMVYPQFQNGEYDLDNGNHYLEIDNIEWYQALSEKDLEIIYKALGYQAIPIV